MPDSLSELEDFKTLKMDVYDDPLLKIIIDIAIHDKSFKNLSDKEKQKKYAWTLITAAIIVNAPLGSLNNKDKDYIAVKYMELTTALANKIISLKDDLLSGKPININNVSVIDINH